MTKGWGLTAGSEALFYLVVLHHVFLNGDRRFSRIGLLILL